jgi:hypothetical protein
MRTGVYISLELHASLAYNEAMVIIETPIFTKQIVSTLTDEEYRLFQTALLERPDAGKIIEEEYHER